MEIATKAYGCRVCDREFATKQALGGHVSHAHGLASVKKSIGQTLGAAPSVGTLTGNQSATPFVPKPVAVGNLSGKPSVTPPIGTPVATPAQVRQVGPSSQIHEQLVASSASSQVATPLSSKQVAPSSEQQVTPSKVIPSDNYYPNTYVLSSAVQQPSYIGGMSDKAIVAGILGGAVICGGLYLIDKKMKHDQEMEKLKFMALEQEKEKNQNVKQEDRLRSQSGFII